MRLGEMLKEIKKRENGLEPYGVFGFFFMYTITTAAITTIAMITTRTIIQVLSELVLLEELDETIVRSPNALVEPATMVAFSVKVT